MARVHADAKFMGAEPLAPIEDRFDTKLADALTWYRYYHSIEDGLDWLKSYMKTRKYSAEEIRNVLAQTNTMYICVLARMTDRGVKLGKKLQLELQEWIDVFRSKSIMVKLVEELDKPKPSIQENIREKLNQVRGTIDHDVLDKFFLSNYVFFEPNVYQILQEQKIASNQCQSLLSYYQELLDEFETIRDDKELCNLTAKQKKDYHKFFTALIGDIERYASNKRKVAPKPRKKKEKSALQLAKKVKYLKDFPDLKLVSIDPATIVGTSILWTYNTKTRKLSQLVSSDKPLSVKGTTVIDFDPSKSFSKTLRKPAESLGKLLKAGPKAALKVFGEISTKATEASPRLNSDTILLRTIK